MIKEENAKIVTLAFVMAGFLTAFTAMVLFEFAAVYFGPAARAYGQEWIRHGVPVGLGFLMFLFLQVRHSTRLWAHEVTVETRKVVWPGRKETMGMTVMVCVILMLAGFVLGLFDLVASAVVNYIID